MFLRLKSLGILDSQHGEERVDSGELKPGRDIHHCAGCLRDRSRRDLLRARAGFPRSPHHPQHRHRAGDGGARRCCSGTWAGAPASRWCASWPSFSRSRGARGPARARRARARLRLGSAQRRLVRGCAPAPGRRRPIYCRWASASLLLVGRRPRTSKTAVRVRHLAVGRSACSRCSSGCRVTPAGFSRHHAADPAAGAAAVDSGRSSATGAGATATASRTRSPCFAAVTASSHSLMLYSRRRPPARWP